MNARRDALAHRFIAITLEEVRTWPPQLQVELHAIAFSLPELVLELDARAACAWTRRWRARIEQALAEPAPPAFGPDDAWIDELAREWTERRAPGAEMTAEEVARLAARFARLGPLALAIPWRFETTKA